MATKDSEEDTFVTLEIGKRSKEQHKMSVKLEIAKKKSAGSKCS